MQLTETLTLIIAILGSSSLTVFLKWFLYDRKNNVTKALENLTDEITKVSMVTKRLELLNLIQHEPKNKMAINRVYDEYKQLNGNSYISGIYKDWLKGKKAKQ